MDVLDKVRQLRRDATQMEKVMWQELRSRLLIGYKFRRQYPIGPYIVDFVCLAEKLIIELDGNHHSQPEQVAYDRVRTEFLKADAYQILRFDNREVSNNLPQVLQTIKLALKAPRPQGEGLG